MEKVTTIGVHGHQLMKPFTNTVKHVGKKELKTIQIERKNPKESTQENSL